MDDPRTRTAGRSWEVLTTCFAFQAFGGVGEGASTEAIETVLPSNFILNAVRAVPVAPRERFALVDGDLDLNIGDRRYFRAPLAALDVWLVLSPCDLRITPEHATRFACHVPALVFVRGLEYRDSPLVGVAKSHTMESAR